MTDNKLSLTFTGDIGFDKSLGNFIYDTDYQRAQINTDIGVVLKINLDENGYDFEAIGTNLLSLSCPCTHE